MSAPLDRRAFLVCSGGALAVAALVACGGTTSSGPKIEIGALPDLFSDRATLERIGKYAVRAGGVGSRSRDVAAALAPNASASWIGSATAPAIREHLRTRIAEDFARDRIVDVAGWQLPLTEARVAALVYLSR
jgi:hypothetical protein